MSLDNNKRILYKDNSIMLSLSDKVMDSKDLIKLGNSKIHYFHSYKRSLFTLILFCIVLVIAFIKYTNQFKMENILDQRAIHSIKYSPGMSIVNGMPMIFEFDDLTIELSVDYGQFYLNHSYKLIPEEDGNIAFVPAPGYEGGYEYLEKHYVMDESTTIYWSPIIPSIPKIINGEYDKEYLESIEPIAYNAIINYKTYKGKRKVETGMIIIEFLDNYYTVTLKKG